MGITINNYKDPYQTTSMMESKKVFFVVQLGVAPFSVIVTTRIITFLVDSDSYSPSFAAITGKRYKPKFQKIRYQHIKNITPY